MGSFNVGCAITDGMICEGEEVYLIPIQKQSYSKVKGELTYKGKIYQNVIFEERPVYFNDVWKVIAKPFKAVYADYGLFEVKDYEVLEPFYLFLEESAASISVGENEYHDIPFNLEDFKKANKEKKFKMVMEATRKQRLFAFNIIKNEITEIQFAVVKAEVVKDFSKKYEESLKLSIEISKLNKKTDLTIEDKNKLNNLYETTRKHPIGNLWDVEYILEEMDLLRFIETIAVKKSLSEDDLNEIEEMFDKHKDLIFAEFHILSFAYSKNLMYQAKKNKKEDYTKVNFDVLLNGILTDFQTTYMRKNITQIMFEKLFSYTQKNLLPVNYKGQVDDYFNTLYYLIQKEHERAKARKEECC